MLIRDDRGSPFTPRPRGAGLELGALPSSLPNEPPVPVPDVPPTLLQGLVLMGTPAAIVLLGFALAGGVATAGWPGAVPLSIAVTTVVLAAFSVRWVHRALGQPVYVTDRRLRASGRCLVCQYSLRGIGSQPDGCTVCPECGAAWRLPVARVTPR